MHDGGLLAFWGCRVACLLWGGLAAHLGSEQDMAAGLGGLCGVDGVVHMAGGGVCGVDDVVWVVDGGWWVQGWRALSLSKCNTESIVSVCLGT
ncbi:hypothetical protein B0J11DRAFT_533300 [Dendryphion nanum]|uniref:Secreted protein n=1 Tax=Dendryphion nanum TaxID=256645 RepID=A0A9P9DKZ0_9PLEO|nr:hypothetical protein B0J11DRAFT_533300 [Dendryphion nanum]